MLAGLFGASASRAAAGPGDDPAPRRLPNVLVLTVDALRSDRLSGYGYRRPTSPAIDRLLASGARFDAARTVEPLTNPALCSLLTSLYPHRHGATRNGLRLRNGLDSLPRVLARRGYRTAAFVGSWVLANRISGLGEHFDRYAEVLTRKRWFGMWKGEATAEDLTDAALTWLRDTADDARPFLLWVHYVEPHAPYRLQAPFAPRLGIATHGEVTRSDRYDTEIAMADHHLGRLLAALDGDPRRRGAETLVVFTADHGESLGEHGYWGHGRDLHEPSLRVPLGFSWPGHVPAGTVESAPALLLDVAPTVLGLLGLRAPAAFQGFDWAPVLSGAAAPPRARISWFEAHRGAVLAAHESASARRSGLLAVGMLAGSRKEIVQLAERRLIAFDLDHDPGETVPAPLPAAAPSARLAAWLAAVQQDLAAVDRLPALPRLDAENLARLRALGYAE
jgi:arylsulfatase A-like enzyme